MTRILKLAAAVLLLGTFLAPRAAGEETLIAPPPVPEATDAERAEAVEGNTAFALELYARLGEAKKGENLFFSPYSISTALAMTSAGARGNTAAEMRKTLHFTLKGNRLHSTMGALVDDLNKAGAAGKFKLSVANALWGQQGYKFLDSFLALNDNCYGAGLRTVDFAGKTEEARQTINKWVEDQTQEKIKDLLPPGVLTVDTRLVLTNAIYFKGDWASKFKEKNTKDQPFTTAGGRKVDAPLMFQQEEFGYMKGDDFQALAMPYAGDRLEMIVLLPAKADGLDGLEKSLSADKLGQWLGRLRKNDVMVYLPRFKMTSEFSLSKELKALGMTDAFTSGKADFSGMTGGRDLFIGAVVHKAFVEVNEEGTEAAAATGVVVGVTSMPPPPPVFRADRPFLFLIRDRESGGLLFMGRVTDPTK